MSLIFLLSFLLDLENASHKCFDVRMCYFVIVVITVWKSHALLTPEGKRR